MNRTMMVLGCLLGVVVACPKVWAIEPLSVSQDDRHLIDSTGQPVFFQGDAAWSLIVGPTLAEAEDYLQDRADRGFNVVIVNLIEHFFNGPLNAEGQHPFLNPGNPDFTQPNSDYFDHAEAVISAAEARGIYVLLTPAYLGYPGTAEGWYNEVNANGDVKMREYGRLVGDRFKDYDNIIWMAGGDRNPDAATSEMLAMIEGIREMDPTGNLYTGHTLPEASPADHYGSEDWFTVSNAYSYNLSYLRVLEERDNIPTRPVFLMEDRYENEFGAFGHELRRSKWWAAASGTTGVIMGNRPIWLFDPDWQDELDSQLSNDMDRLGQFMRSIEWWKLEPDSGHDVVTAGFGSFGSGDYVTASFAADGSLLLTYLPDGGNVTVDLSQFADEVNFSWFDPTSGILSAIGLFTNTGSQVFNAPGLNEADDLDWVLLGQVVADPLGDTDGDGDVDADDLFNVKENFGDPGPASLGDADGDGDTDIDDLVAVKNNFGNAQSPGTAIPGLSPGLVPEPASVVLVGIGGLMLTLRARRVARRLP